MERIGLFHPEMQGGWSPVLGYFVASGGNLVTVHQVMFQRVTHVPLFSSLALYSGTKTATWTLEITNCLYIGRSLICTYTIVICKIGTKPN